MSAGTAHVYGYDTTQRLNVVDDLPEEDVGSARVTDAEGESDQHCQAVDCVEQAKQRPDVNLSTSADGEDGIQGLDV